ncbi:hypothetical protein PMZ80_001832 [Knufia obscura]|uniref:Uncharacterized protein n=1 Tax=Knufia obscura TaxID=1635080 RepID=A0ABR0S5A4_9EURO|nr:hypothetical protein PMZ80_001832 [Knufia obscura]
MQLSKFVDTTAGSCIDKNGQPPTPTFLGIPCELRMLIYEFLIGDRTFWINFAPTAGNQIQSGIIGSLKVLRLSKQIHDETHKILKVRTLRINQFSETDFHKFGRVRELISGWTSTIEVVVVSYRLIDIIDRTPNDLFQPTVLRGLQEIVSMPNLRAITFEEKYMEVRLGDVELEERAKAYAVRLGLRIAAFQHISATAKKTLEHEMRRRYWTVEMKFVKCSTAIDASVTLSAAPHKNTLTSCQKAAQAEPTDGRRQVLLEVPNGQSPQVSQKHWLTIA